MSGDDHDTQAKPPLAGRRAAPAQPPVVALRMETLLTWTAERVAKFPRDHKFTVGDRLVETCLDIMSNLVEASYKRDKQALLTSASRALVRARVLVRLAHSLRCLSESQQPQAESRRLPSPGLGPAQARAPGARARKADSVRASRSTGSRSGLEQRVSPG
jgi:hypothetical protein